MLKRFGIIFIGLLVVISLTLLAFDYVTMPDAANNLFLMRSVTEDDTALDLTTKGDYANKPATAIALPLSPQNAVPEYIEIFCAAAGNDGEDFGIRIFAWRDANGPAILVGTSSAYTLGTQAVIKFPEDGSAATGWLWGDTTGLTERWSMDLESPGIQATVQSNNSPTPIIIPTRGYRHWWVEIVDLDGGGEPTAAKVYYSYW